MRVGGPTALAAFPTSRAELSRLIQTAKEHNVRHIIVGNASNILFSDRGFDGLAIFTTAMRNIVWNGSSVTADCGASLTGLAAAATKRGLSGLEFAFGIPGTIGGAVYMNAGAYGSQVSAVLASSEYLKNGEILKRTAEEHKFGYRTSVYRSTDDIILSAEFTLTPGDPEEIAAKAKQNMDSRRSKQPLEYPNAGSVFKRPEGAFPGALIEEADSRASASAVPKFQKSTPTLSLTAEVQPQTIFSVSRKPRKKRFISNSASFWKPKSSIYLNNLNQEL